MSVDPRIVST